MECWSASMLQNTNFTDGSIDLLTDVEIQIWDLFEGHHLFDGRGPDGRYSDA